MFNVQLSVSTWSCNYKTCPQKSYEASARDSGSMGLGKLVLLLWYARIFRNIVTCAAVKVQQMCCN